MRKAAVIAAMIMVALLFENWAKAGVSIIMNGSFERDREGITDIKVVAPQRWCDVSWPDDPDKFEGYVGTSWQSDGSYCLTLYVQPIPTNAGDMLKVSQEVYLEDVNEITFDLKLSSALSFLPWEPAIRTAVVQIDGNDVWKSSDWWPPDENGEYRNWPIEVNDVYKDANLHTLSLGIRTIVDDEPEVEYYADWDFVRFDTHYESSDYLPQDIDQDYYVDIYDLALLTGQWLVKDPNEEYDLFEDEDNIVNFRDFAVFADGWPRSYGPLPQADLNDDGIINLRDFAILANHWADEGYCIRADIDRSGESTAVVDYKDLSIMAEQWLRKSWLYGLTTDN